VRLLLDTHALIWWLSDNKLLSKTANEAVAEPSNVVYVSAASAWEIATKHRIGKLPLAGRRDEALSDVIAREQFRELPISLSHGESAGALPGAPRDPFDRMLIAQALAENLTLVSNERLFDAFGVVRLW
jgi:PIN domain nuclease of toxin-antitoxin system